MLFERPNFIAFCEDLIIEDLSVFYDVCDVCIFFDKNQKVRLVRMKTSKQKASDGRDQCVGSLLIIEYERSLGL